EPDWDKLRALWTELEFHTLLRQGPAPAAAETPAGDVVPLAAAAALPRYLAQVPAGDPLAIESVGEGGPPDPTITALGLYHPEAGAGPGGGGAPRGAPAAARAWGRGGLARGGAGPRAGGGARRPDPDRPRREGARRVVAGPRGGAAARGGHRGRRVPAQSRAHELQARGGVRRAPGRRAGHRAAGHARQVDLGSLGDG